MPKHNNIIHNQHFHKDWARYTKVNFNQPAQKKARRVARLTKAKALAPRPLNKLRPIVRGQTNKYNNKIKAGRGFTLDELKAAGINAIEAPGVGIAVDHRRQNRSEEAFQLNVQRLKEYKSRLVVFPRKSGKALKKGDSTKEEQAQAKQVLSKDVLPIAVPFVAPAARAITEAEKKVTVTAVLRKARTDEKLKGVREVRAKAKEAAKAAPKGKSDDE